MRIRIRPWLIAVAGLLATGFMMPGIFTENTRVAFIESEEIMKRYYDWQQAQQRIDGAANVWKKELADLQASLHAKEDSLERYRLIWSGPEKEAMAHQITDVRRKVQDYWAHKFGPGASEYAQLNKEVLTPIYEKVFAVIQEIAKQEGYDYVFDKTGEVLLLYANPAHDLTRDVMEKLGIKDTAGVPARTPFGPGGKPTIPPPNQQNVPPSPGQGSPFDNLNRPH